MNTRTRSNLWNQDRATQTVKSWGIGWTVAEAKASASRPQGDGKSTPGKTTPGGGRR